MLNGVPQRLWLYGAYYCHPYGCAGPKSRGLAEIPTFPQEEDLPDLSTEAFYVDLEELRQEEHDA